MSTPGIGAAQMHGMVTDPDGGWMPRPRSHNTSYGAIVDDVLTELVAAVSVFPSMVSAHEGFAILKEEVDELWDAVRMKQSDPDRPHAMRVEALQVAAMALRFLHDVCGDE